MSPDRREWTTIVEIPEELYDRGREAAAEHGFMVWAERAEQLGYRPSPEETRPDGVTVWAMRMHMRTDFETGEHYLHVQGPVIDPIIERALDNLADPHDGT